MPKSVYLMITRATIVRQDHGPDNIFLETTLPTAVWPFSGTETVRLDAARGTAEQYLRDHFPGLVFDLVEVGHK